MSDTRATSHSLSRYFHWYITTLRHTDLLYYRWTLSALLCGYFLCALVFVPKVLPVYPKVAWSVLGWGTLSAAITLVSAIALRFLDPGSVTTLPQTTTAVDSAATVHSDSAAVCPHCRTVHAARTRYCRRCRICVKRYDHHCAITDLCIGQSNYRVFLLTLTAGLVTACLGSYLTYHLVLALLTVQPLYHPRSVLAVVTFVCIAYAAFLLLTYTGVHCVLLFSNRTLVEMWAKRKERRRKGEWSVVDRRVWRRRWYSVSEVVTGGGQPMRCVELREKESAMSHEERQVAEGWTDDDIDDAKDEIHCLPTAAIAAV